MQNLLYRTLCALSCLGLLAGEASNEPIVAVAQLGGGYRTLVVCSGSKLSARRVDHDEVVLSCGNRGARFISGGAVAGSGLSLDPGQSLVLLCEGARLETRRTGGAQMRAACVPTPGPAA